MGPFAQYKHEPGHPHPQHPYLQRAKPYLIGAGALFLLQMACGRGCSSHAEEYQQRPAYTSVTHAPEQKAPTLELLVQH